VCRERVRPSAGPPGRRAGAEGGRTDATAWVTAGDRPRSYKMRECTTVAADPKRVKRARRHAFAGHRRKRRPLFRVPCSCRTRGTQARRDVPRCVDESLGNAAHHRSKIGVHRPNARSRPIRNGPQPRSRGKPGRDAKSVVPGLRPGDRRARRRWPAAAGMFWRRELVTCETVTGVVIGLFSVTCVGGPPVGGPATPVEVCHSACEMGRSPKHGRIPFCGHNGTCRIRRLADRCDPRTDASASASPVALLSCVIGDRPSALFADDRTAHKFTKSRVSRPATYLLARSGTPRSTNFAQLRA
jgi:hypothetical protein